MAIDLVSRNPSSVAALILENTFMSVPALVRDWPAPFGPLSFLCTQRWPSIERIPLIPREVPLLMLSGDEDAVVPPKHMQGLWVAAKQRGSAISEQHEEDDEEEKERVSCSPFYLCAPGIRDKSKKAVRKHHIPSRVDVEKAIADEMSGLRSPASIWNGKDLFRYFCGTGHGEFPELRIPDLQTNVHIVSYRKHVARRDILVGDRSVAGPAELG